MPSISFLECDELNQTNRNATFLTWFTLSSPPIPLSMWPLPSESDEIILFLKMHHPWTENIYISLSLTWSITPSMISILWPVYVHVPWFPSSSFTPHSLSSLYSNRTEVRQHSMVSTPRWSTMWLSSMQFAYTHFPYSHPQHLLWSYYLCFNIKLEIISSLALKPSGLTSASSHLPGSNLWRRQALGLDQEVPYLH